MANMFADPEIVKLWNEAVAAHREKTKVDLESTANKEKTTIFVSFWNSLRPKKTSSLVSTKGTKHQDHDDDEKPIKPEQQQVDELIDKLTAEHEQFQSLRNDGGKIDKIRHGLGKFASAMAGVGPVLERLAEDTPAAIVAVAFTHIMTSFTEVSADLDLIQNLFVIMRSFAERLGLLKRVPEEQRFRNLILKTFTHMLEFCTRAHMRLKKDQYRVKEWAKALFRGQDNELKEAYDRVVTAIDDMGSAIVAQTLASVLDFENKTERMLQRGFSRMDSGFRRVNSGLSVVLSNQRYESQRGQRRDEEQRGFREEIRQHNDRIFNILVGKNAKSTGSSDARRYNSLAIITKSLFTGAEELIQQRWVKMEREFVKNTFAWFNDDFEKLKTMDGGVWYIGGESGMGKSFFSFAIYSRLALEFENDPFTSVASFIFDENFEKLERVDNVLYFCSAQIASTDNSYRQHIQSLVDDDEKGEWKKDAWDKLYGSTFAKTATKGRRLYLVLDGIDQLENDQLSRLFRYIKQAAGLRIIFVISGTRDLKRRLPRVDHTITLDQAVLSGDFKLLTQSRVELYPGLVGLRSSLKRKLCSAMEMSADSFFYVNYMLRQLNTMKIASLIESSLRPVALPKNTDAIYHQLFQECEQYYTNINEKKALGYLFTWLAYSYDRVSLDAAQKLVDLVLVAVLGDRKLHLDIKTEILGRLAKILSFSEPEDNTLYPESPDVDDDNNEGIPRFSNRKETTVPEVLVSFQQHSLRDYFIRRHDPATSSDLQPTEHQARIMMFKLTTTILTTPKAAQNPSLVSVATKYAFYHLVEAQPLSSPEEVKAVAEDLYALLGCGDGALRTIEGQFEFQQDSEDVEDFCSIFGFTRDEVNEVLAALLAISSQVSKLPAQHQLSEKESHWVSSTLRNSDSIFITVAMGHVRNWLDSDKTVTSSKAFAGFRFAHVALCSLTASALRSLIQGPQLKLKRGEIDSGVNIWPDEDFEAVAIIGRYPQPLGPQEYKQISKALHYDLRNMGAQRAAEKGLKLAKDSRDIFDLRYRIARARFDEWVYPEHESSGPGVTPEAVLAAWNLCLSDIPPVDPKDQPFKNMLNAAYQMKARVESTLDAHHRDALASMQMAATFQTTESCTRVFEELVVAFGDKKLYAEIIQLLKALSEWSNPLTIRCTDVTHRHIHRAAMATDEKSFVRKLYVEAASSDTLAEDTSTEESDIRIWLSLFDRFVMNEPRKAQNQLLKLVQNPPSKISFFASERAARHLADIYLEEFRISRSLSYKLGVLTDMESTVVQMLKDRLGLEFKPKLSKTSTIVLAVMRRKVGPAEQFYNDLNDSFEACCQALTDGTEVNDAPSLRLLAKVLSVLVLPPPGRIGESLLKEDAQVALSCQFYLLPSAGGVSTKRPSQQQVTKVDRALSSKRITSPKGTNSPRRMDSPKRTVSPAKATVPVQKPEGKYAFNKSAGLECAMCSKILTDFSQGKVYTCVYCTNVDLCEECYRVRESHYDSAGILENGDVISPSATGVNGKAGVIGKRPVNDYVEVCPWGHMLVESPVKGWKGVRKDGVLEYGGEEIKFSDWLEGLKGRWERAWWRYWREVEQ
ncbi:hypothetical protein QC763_311050 [Podospora pseudopauciseta]|uniref:Fungal STAND N-terminal Goodbye domain-containing protein n=1 Tax=Podospora pseudopauciseta TaxID=2093780 RepID=A0ABR0HHU8_9PEZI|nr:hypothetical protein QC763_311050 [Podospora pseudopauciseta]